MKFTSDELFEMAKEFYQESDHIPEGAGYYNWREGIGEWADESSHQEYKDKEEVLEELQGYLEDSREIENRGNFLS